MSRYQSSYTGEHRTVTRSLKFTPSEAAHLDARAEQRGVNWSDFGRELMLRRAADPAVDGAADRPAAAGSKREQRTVKRTLQLTPGEAAELDEGANDRGLNWSDYVREVLLRRRRSRLDIASGITRADLVDLKRRLDNSQHAHNAVGNLLNQIARHANTTGQLERADLDNLKDALGDTKRAVDEYTTTLQLMQNALLL
jgi:Bacterial mobilisation protein (MobC)